MYASQEEIERIAKDKSVTEVSVWDNSPVQPATNSVHEQIHTDSTTGTKSTNFNNGTGYKGTGIKIGIIEAIGEDADNPNLCFNVNSPQLSSIYGTRLFYVDQNGDIATVPSSYGVHATMVTTIIVGQRYTVGNDTYEGVVPNATVYQATVMYPEDLVNQIQNLSSNFGVSVINFSASMYSEGYGNKSELEIDKEIENTGISFVCTAGNSAWNVGTPGICFNAITVGNVYTKLDTGNLITAGSYSMNETSSYAEPSNVSNKPDIVAPGTNIACLISNNEVIQDSGTSFAAPLVTGVIAQILQTDETLSEYRSRVKAILLAGADPTVISTLNNPVKYSDNAFIRNKSGAGMVNAVNSIRIAENFQHAGCVAYFDSTSTLGENTLKSIYLSTGQTIRVVLTYKKIFDDSDNAIEFEAGLALKNGNTVCISSDHSYCNVEIIEYTATTAGNYDIVADVYYLYTTQNHSSGSITVAWRIIN